MKKKSSLALVLALSVVMVGCSAQTSPKEDSESFEKARISATTELRDFVNFGINNLIPIPSTGPFAEKHNALRATHATLYEDASSISDKVFVEEVASLKKDFRNLEKEAVEAFVVNYRDYPATIESDIYGVAWPVIDGKERETSIQADYSSCVPLLDEVNVEDDREDYLEKVDTAKSCFEDIRKEASGINGGDLSNKINNEKGDKF